MRDNPLYHSLIEHANDIVMVLDNTPLEEGGPLIVYVNPMFETLMGYRKEDVIGQPAAMLNGPDTDRHARYKIRKALREGSEIRTEIVNYTRTGDPLWLEINLFPLHDKHGKLEYFAAIERDLTEQKRLQARLEKMATIDPLTELPNRQHILKLARREFSRSQRYHRPFSILMIDIDHFKKINDDYGHAGGDQVLHELGKLCSMELRDPDVLGRLGGEEFVLLLPDTPKSNAVYVAERIRQRLMDSLIQIDKKSLRVTASIGVAALDAEDEEFSNMLDRADMAMYDAKQAGRNQVKVAA